MKNVKEKGITLIEVLVAIAIFGLLMGVLMAMMQQEQKIIRNSEQLLKANLKANEVMETLKAEPFEELQSSSTSFISDSAAQKVQILISDFDDLTSLKKIVVTVSWIDHEKHERQYMLTTLRSRFSLNINNVNKTALESGVQGG